MSMSLGIKMTMLLSGRGAGLSAYASKVLGTQSNDLIVYYPMDETSGTTADNAEGTAARDGTYSGVTLADSAGGTFPLAPHFDPANDSFLNVFSTSLRDAFNEQEGTVHIWMKVNGAGVWTDDNSRKCLTLLADGNNYVTIGRTTANNFFAMEYKAGGVSENLNVSTWGGRTDWIPFAITWSVAADEVKFYAEGAQVGATGTGLGTWVGNLASNSTLVGARATTPTEEWHGWLRHTAVWTTPLSAAEIAALATV